MHGVCYYWTFTTFSNESIAYVIINCSKLPLLSMQENFRYFHHSCDESHMNDKSLPLREHLQWKRWAFMHVCICYLDWPISRFLTRYTDTPVIVSMFVLPPRSINPGGGANRHGYKAQEFVTIFSLPYTQQVFISINFCHFCYLRWLILKVANFTNFYICYNGEKPR